MRACAFPHCCKYVKHTQTANDSCHTPKREEKRWRRNRISHLPAATSYPDETLHRLKKQKMLKFDQAHLGIGATEGRRGKVWRKWHVSGSSALRVESFTLKKKIVKWSHRGKTWLWISRVPSLQENREVCLCCAANSLLFSLWIITVEHFPEKMLQKNVEKLFS